MKFIKPLALFTMLFSLPLMLYFSNEYLLAQILFFSQLIVIWSMLPFMFRGESATPKDWNKKTSAFALIVVAASVVPFLVRLTEGVLLVSTDISQSSVRLFSESSEIFLVLGVALATFFVIAALIKRREQEA